MSQFVPLVIPTTGKLDTANPSMNRPVGTMFETVDFAHRWWGPRLGARSYTWAGKLTGGTEPPGASSLHLDGNNTYVKGALQREQADLGTSWTIDVAFHLNSGANPTNQRVPFFQWRTLVGSARAIEVGCYGSAYPDPTKANHSYCLVKTTDTAGAIASTIEMVGGTPSVDPGLTYTPLGGEPVPSRYFMRVTRDGATLQMADSAGAANGTYSVPANEPHLGTGAGSWLLANDAGLGVNALWRGLLLRVVLRTTAALADPTFLPMLEHCYPRCPDVIFAIDGGYTPGSGTMFVLDKSSFGAHGFINAPSASTPATDRYYPFAKMTQGIGSFTDRYGIVTNAVLVGGTLATQRVR